MEDESRFRVESPDEEEKEKTGLLKPLPESVEPSAAQIEKAEPIVKLLGISMTEKRRDRFLFVLVPMLAGLIDAAMFSQIIVARLESTVLVTFVFPLVVAIPIGLVVGRTNQTIFAALLATVFFVLFFMLFLISPALLWPALDIGLFLLNGVVVAVVYMLLVVFGSLFGALIGILVREFL
ncbi:MAG: hypothetical protein ACFFFC_16885 [Candidatus Thorarchaeota archaeon]